MLPLVQKVLLQDTSQGHAHEEKRHILRQYDASGILFLMLHNQYQLHFTREELYETTENHFSPFKNELHSADSPNFLQLLITVPLGRHSYYSLMNGLPHTHTGLVQTFLVPQASCAWDTPRSSSFLLPFWKMEDGRRYLKDSPPPCTGCSEGPSDPQRVALLPFVGR